MTTLLWIRDHYDFNENRYIDANEARAAEEDFFGSGTITEDQYWSTHDAYWYQTLLPAYADPPPTPDPCDGVTCPNKCSGYNLYKQKCVNGSCVNDYLIEGNSPTCGYTPPTPAVTCNGNSPHYGTGCALLKAADVDNDGVISYSELSGAGASCAMGHITEEEYYFVEDAYNACSINALCPDATLHHAHSQPAPSQ